MAKGQPKKGSVPHLKGGSASGVGRLQLNKGAKKGK